MIIELTQEQANFLNKEYHAGEEYYTEGHSINLDDFPNFIQRELGTLAD
jgi:hypothetical protein